MGRRAVPLAGGALAALLVAVGVIYLVVECENIPAPLPGRQAGSTDHRVGFAIVAFVLAALVLAAGSFGGRLRSRSTVG
jgi:hypothetical protein